MSDHIPTLNSDWSPADVAKLVAGVEAGLSAGQIQPTLRVRRSRSAVLARAHRMGLVLTGGWSRGDIALVKAAAAAGLSAGEVAPTLSVARSNAAILAKAHRMGLSLKDGRPGRAGGRGLWPRPPVARPTPPRCAPRRGGAVRAVPDTGGPVIDAAMRALIDAAVAAGKVTVLPPGQAAGLSSIEQRFHVGPAGNLDWRTSQHQNQKAGAEKRRRAGL
ncbi:hypothetical protein [Reyranella sp.]|uniref:hypothetical protein n=1 Tax=Reyranella sp. TaxID=1929291 RepID=UPI002731F0E5|nr:hypothetical protein [Reyranella sp.]MDP2376556.1 hypothetical protein [Reyranella sp.]